MAKDYPRNIVEAFGGIRPMARKTGLPFPTISSWMRRGAIPDDHKPKLLEAAQSHGIALSKIDFFPATSVATPQAGR